MKREKARETVPTANSYGFITKCLFLCAASAACGAGLAYLGGCRFDRSKPAARLHKTFPRRAEFLPHQAIGPPGARLRHPGAVLRGAGAAGSRWGEPAPSDRGNLNL